MSAPTGAAPGHAAETATANPHLATAKVNAQRPHLYVGNLSPRVTDVMLQEIFSVAGPVRSVKIIPDRSFTQGGLNYGFIEYVDPRFAEAAIQSLNGRNILDSEIKVNWAKQSQQGGGRQDLDHVGKEDSSGNYHVFVGDLVPEINDAALRQAFAGFSSLADVRVMWDMNTGKSRGYGFVSFKDKADAEQSIATMNGEWLGSRAIRVNWANQKTHGGSGHRTGGNAMGMGRNGALGLAGVGSFMGGGMPSLVRLGPTMPMPQPFSGNAAGDIGGTGFSIHSASPLLTQSLSYEQVLAATPPNVTTVYCGNLPPYSTQNDLMALMSSFGYVVEVRMQPDRGYAFVKLDSHEHAANAIYSLNLNGCTIHNRPTKVSWGKERSETGSTTAIAASAVLRATGGGGAIQSGPSAYQNLQVYAVPNPAQAAYNNYSSFGFAPNPIAGLASGAPTP